METSATIVASLALLLLFVALVLVKAARGPAVPVLDADHWVARPPWDCALPGALLPEEWAFSIVDVTPGGHSWSRMARDEESAREAFLDFVEEHYWLPTQALHIRAYSWGGEAWVMVSGSRYSPGRGLRRELDAAMSRPDPKKLKSRAGDSE